MTETAQPFWTGEIAVKRFVESVFEQRLPSQQWVLVAIATPLICNRMDVAENTEIRLSADTVATHLHHKQATPDVYAFIIRHLMQEGQLLQDKIGRWSLIGSHEGKMWNTGLKRVQSHNSASKRDEIWLTSVRRMDLRNFNRKFAKSSKRAGEPENA